MDVNFWSVPILSHSAIDLPGKYGQRMQRTTTVYNVGDRRHHTLAVRWLHPGTLLTFFFMVLAYFVLAYMLTFFVPGILLAITKDESLSWVFAVWALVILVLAAVISRHELMKKLMTRHALKERGLSTNTKIAIVPDGRWERWAAKLK